MTNSNTVKQALINEYKGNLFEFLVGKELSLLAHNYSDFVGSITKQYLNALTHYEIELRSLAPNLLKELVILSKNLSLKLRETLKLDSEKIELVGKDETFKASEADLLVYKKEPIHLSLKFCKSKAYINTKSAGVKSFINKYFSYSSLELQKEFNEKFDFYFEVFSRDLHDQHGLTYNGNYKAWLAEGLPDLPGQLEKKDRELIHLLYRNINKELYKCIKKLLLEDQEMFYTSLNSILGFSDKRVTQAICFHSGTDSYQFDSIVIDSFKSFKKINLLEFKDVGNFEMEIDDNKILQLRVKPMNKFTSGGFKINCSVKYY